ncbi:hypothetical protein VP01_210g1 [Puccinia sorghi]|uniref:HTH CENPB-type domain-containing protein n=1 Tax=Puccinia sorghi TaxID=27349 RepID=A0A0L6VAN8_9BASI|nr:hypothetical protein VP01_210g1 [Puccinia sorghi]
MLSRSTSSTLLQHINAHDPTYHHPMPNNQQQHQHQLNHHHHHHLYQQQPMLPAYHHHHIHARSLSTSTVSGRPPPKTSRRQSKLNNLDRRRIYIAVQWGIDRSSVSKILKYRDKWLSISPTARAAKVIKHRGGRFPQLESEVDVALDVSQEMGLGEGAFKASNGWLDAFKERAQIKGGRFLDLSRTNPSSINNNTHNSDQLAIHEPIHPNAA